MACPGGALSPQPAQPPQLATRKPHAPQLLGELHGGTARYIAQERLLTPGQRVLVAFSGGPDSTALLVALHELGYDVVAGHVDHALRPGSAADADHAARTAGALGIPFSVRRLDPPAAGQDHTSEAAARAARYAALQAMSDAAGTTAIATGHTLDDDAETVLLRLGRGGIPLGIPPRRGAVVRPLLGVRRSQTHQFCAHRGLAVLTDPTNADQRYARNRIRATVLPDLGDAGIQMLATTGASTRAAKATLEEAAGQVLNRASRPAAEGICLSRPALMALTGKLGRATLRQALEPYVAEASTHLVHQLWNALVVAGRGPLDLPSGQRAWLEGDALILGTPPRKPTPDPLPLTVPGRTSAPGWDLTVLAERATPAHGAILSTAGWEVFLDAGAVQAAVQAAGQAAGPLAFRTRRPGDSYRPAGGTGKRKVQDLWVDAKVPRAARDRLPLLTCGDQLIWAGGQRVAHGFACTAATTTALRIQVFPLLKDGQLVRSMGGSRGR